MKKKIRYIKENSKKLKVEMFKVINGHKRRRNK